MYNPLIIEPVVTEKSLSLAASENKYTFIVARNSHKHQIREAIEQLYKVDVVSINTIKGHKSQKATGKKRIKVMVPAIKKAVIELRKGQTIGLFEFGGAEQTTTQK